MRPHGPHAAAVRTLERWRSRDQEELRRGFLEVLARHPEALTRAGRPDHLTASALVVDAGAHQVLLVHHRKVGRWLQAGGHLEPADGSLVDAALREATEETGLTGLVPTAGGNPVRLDVHPAPCGARHHLDVQYVLVAAAADPPRVGPESLDVRWWPVDALPEPTDDAVRRLVAAAVQLAHPPLADPPLADAGRPSSSAAVRPSR